MIETIKTVGFRSRLAKRPEKAEAVIEFEMQKFNSVKNFNIISKSTVLRISLGLLLRKSEVSRQAAVARKHSCTHNGKPKILNSDAQEGGLLKFPLFCASHFLSLIAF